MVPRGWTRHWVAISGLLLCGTLTSMFGWVSGAEAADGCAINPGTVGIGLAEVGSYGNLRIKVVEMVEGGSDEGCAVDMKAPGFERRGVLLYRDQLFVKTICNQEVSIVVKYVYSMDCSITVSVF